MIEVGLNPSRGSGGCLPASTLLPGRMAGRQLNLAGIDGSWWSDLPLRALFPQLTSLARWGTTRSTVSSLPGVDVLDELDDTSEPRLLVVIDCHVAAVGAVEVA